MGSPHAILCVPTEAGAALLASGPLGHRVPLVSRWDPDNNRYGWQALRCRNVRALPLLWDGALVPDGWDRARRVCAGSVDQEADDLSSFDRSLLLWLPPPEVVLRLARRLQRLGLCRVVVLDLVDGALVERAP